MHPDPEILQQSDRFELTCNSRQESGAYLSADGKYRYMLWRTWQPRKLQACWVGFNPSTADARIDDSTVRKITYFTRENGYGGFALVNLFAIRGRDPSCVETAADPVGPRNDHVLAHAFAGSSIIIAAWGALAGNAQPRVKHVISLAAGKPIYRFGTPTQGGHPRHPLYLRKDTQFQLHNINNIMPTVPGGRKETP